MMYYIVETDKSFDHASADLESAVKHHGFGVLHVHDLGTTIRSKGIAFDEECKVFEVCNPGQAAKVLSSDMRLNMALPCRISVFTEKGKTKIGLIKPVKMLSALSQDAALVQVAKEVEEKTIQMVKDVFEWSEATTPRFDERLVRNVNKIEVTS
jgi:uncharacterized protein (DUF302 family)